MPTGNPQPGEVYLLRKPLSFEIPRIRILFLFSALMARPRRSISCHAQAAILVVMRAFDYNGNSKHCDGNTSVVVNPDYDRANNKLVMRALLCIIIAIQ